MIRHGRKPMSMTHGDFDYDYLVALALDPRTGEPRFDHLAFAGHFDSMMFGRRGIKRARREAELQPLPRSASASMFQRLRARARRHALPRPQHDGHAAQHRPDPAARARLPRHGLSDVLLPAGGVHRQRGALEGRLPRVLHRRGLAAHRGGRRRAAALQRRAGRRRALQPHRPRPLRRRSLRDAARRGRPARRPRAARTSSRPSAGWTSRTAARGLRAVRCARAVARHPAVLRSGAPWAAAARAARSAARARSARDAAAADHVRHARVHGRARRAPGLGAAAARRDRATTRGSARPRSACRPAPTRWRTPSPARSCPACAQHSVLDPLENLRLQELLPARPPS